MRIRLWLLAAAAVLVQTPAQAQDFSFSPSGDRWFYPFNGTPGSNNNTRAFGADISETDFDDMDSQIWLEFDTSAQITPGEGPGSYPIQSARVILNVNPTLPGTIYDPSFDLLGTFPPGTDPDDPGRPVELYGVAYRNGFDSSFTETGPYAPAVPPAPLGEDIRNAYATDALGGGTRDVSNFVRDALVRVPWAIGQLLDTNGVERGAGAGYVAGDDMILEIDLSNPDALDYLQAQLDAGEVELMVTSMSEAVMFGGSPIPRFDTKETSGGVAPVFEITLGAAVPALPPVGLWLLGVAVASGGWVALGARRA